MLEIRTSEERLTVEAGEQCSFGRGLDIVDLVLSDDPRIHRLSGTVQADEDGWTLYNDGRWLHLRVSALDRHGHDVLEPGTSLRVPWPRSRVDIVLGSETIGFEVHHLGAQRPTPRRVDLDSGEGRTVVPVRINRRSGAFRALVALCEPQLLDSASDALPTNLEIARRLNRSGREERNVTAKTVERRLDYCRERLELKSRADHGSRVGLDFRASRRQLISSAIMVGLVQVSDLAELDGVGDLR